MKNQTNVNENKKTLHRVVSFTRKDNTTDIDKIKRTVFYIHYLKLDSWLEEKKQFLLDVYHFDDVRYTKTVNGRILMTGHREAKGRRKALEVIFEISDVPVK